MPPEEVAEVENTLGPNPSKRNLRDFWHREVLGKIDKFPCYGVFLLLSGDEKAISYVKQFGRDLHQISGKNCLVMILIGPKLETLKKEPPIVDDILIEEKIWEERIGKAITEQVVRGYTKNVADIFDMGIMDFPSFLLFRDIRSPDSGIPITLKDMSTFEIHQLMREIFSVIELAVKDSKDPLDVLVKKRRNQALLNKGKVVIGTFIEISGFVGTTLATGYFNAMGAGLAS